jgi:hypothetical protein
VFTDVRRSLRAALILAGAADDISDMSAIGRVDVQVQAMLLDGAREHMTRAAVEAAATAPAQTTGTAAVILELSAAAQHLMALR